MLYAASELFSETIRIFFLENTRGVLISQADYELNQKQNKRLSDLSDVISASKLIIPVSNCLMGTGCNNRQLRLSVIIPHSTRRPLPE